MKLINRKKNELYDVPQIKTIQEMVLNSVDSYNEKEAITDLGNTPINSVTYGELLNYILKFGNALKSLGIKERSHIAIIGENRIQWGLSFLTCMCFNHVAIPIDRNLTANEILNIIHESDAEVIIFSDSFTDFVIDKFFSLRKLKYAICMDEVAGEDSIISMLKLLEKNEATPLEELPKINPDELAEIIFTSGSLGHAKGVMLSQRNLASNLVDMLSCLFMYPEDKFLSVLPMHHTYECTCGFLCPLYAGSSIYYARSLRTIVDDLQKVKATIMLGVPLLYDKVFKRISKSIKENRVKSIVIPGLIKVTNITERIGWRGIKKKVFAEVHKKFGGSVRVFIAGGAAADPVVAKGLREFGFIFLQGYGLTETSPILALNRLYNFKDDAAGIPLPNVQIKINNPDENGSGEIWTKAPNVMIGYYKNKLQTEEAFEDGYFKTGDVGSIDKDGFLHINGREKNVIISNSGKNVFPEEIEDILNRSPFVLESMVYGKEDDKHKEVISVKIVVDAEAFIELAEAKGINITDELMEEVIDDEVKKVNKQLASFKRIQNIEIRKEEFVKTTTHKIKRYITEK